MMNNDNFKVVNSESADKSLFQSIMSLKASSATSGGKYGKGAAGDQDAQVVDHTTTPFYSLSTLIPMAASFDMGAGSGNTMPSKRNTLSANASKSREASLSLLRDLQEELEHKDTLLKENQNLMNALVQREAALNQAESKNNQLLASLQAQLVKSQQVATEHLNALTNEQAESARLKNLVHQMITGPLGKMFPDIKGSTDEFHVTNRFRRWVDEEYPLMTAERELNESLRKKVSKLQSDLDESKQSESTALKRLQTQEKKILDLEAHIIQSNQQGAGHAEQIDSLRKMNESLLQSIQNLEQSLQEKHSTLIQTQQALEGSRSRGQQVEQELERLKGDQNNRLDQIQEQAKALNETLLKAEGDKKIAEGQAEALRLSTAECKARLLQLEEAYQNLAKTNAALQGDLDQREQMLRASKRAHQDLLESHQQYLGKTRALKLSLSRYLKLAAENKEKRESKMMAKLQHLKTQNEHLTKSLKNALTLVKQLQSTQVQWITSSTKNPDRQNGKGQVQNRILLEQQKKLANQIIRELNKNEERDYATEREDEAKTTRDEIENVDDYETPLDELNNVIRLLQEGVQQTEIVKQEKPEEPEPEPEPIPKPVQEKEIAPIPIKPTTSREESIFPPALTDPTELRNTIDKSVQEAILKHVQTLNLSDKKLIQLEEGDKKKSKHDKKKRSDENDYDDKKKRSEKKNSSTPKPEKEREISHKTKSLNNNNFELHRSSSPPIVMYQSATGNYYRSGNIPNFINQPTMSNPQPTISAPLATSSYAYNNNHISSSVKSNNYNYPMDECSSCHSASSTSNNSLYSDPLTRLARIRRGINHLRDKVLISSSGVVTSSQF